MKVKQQAQPATYSANMRPAILIILPLALLLGVVAGYLYHYDLELPSRSAPVAHTGPGEVEIQTVYVPSLHLASSSTISGTSFEIFPEGMPDFPDCKELGLGLECDRWDVRMRTGGQNDVIDVKLKAGDQTVGRTELMRVQTAEFDELARLSRMGIREAWMGHVQVAKALRANGLGRLMWKAGDAALRGASGGGAIRVVYDTVGWGRRLMRHVPEAAFLVKEAPIWVYLIQ